MIRVHGQREFVKETIAKAIAELRAKKKRLRGGAYILACTLLQVWIS
jgi:hypothetical protein